MVTKQIPEYTDWIATRPIEITVQIDAGDGRVFDDTFYSLEEMEMRIGRMERSIELQLKEEYNDMIAELLEEEE